MRGTWGSTWDPMGREGTTDGEDEHVSVPTARGRTRPEKEEGSLNRTSTN